jgi:hypothetical protein
MRIHPLLIATAAGVSGAGIGVVVGYKLAYSNLEIQFEERLLRETEGMRKFYEINTADKKPFSTPEEAVATLITDASTEVATTAEKIAYHKIVKPYGADPEVNPDDETALQIMFPEAPEVTKHNVFDGLPVIISQEQFFENELDYVQSTLTWYAREGILTDERDQVVATKGEVDQLDKYVGASNLERFGQNSSDENIVHVRNERLDMEFEVVRHQGSYNEEVLGMEGDPPSRPSGRDV